MGARLHGGRHEALLRIVIGTDTNSRYTSVMRFLPTGWREFLRDGEASIDESRAACDMVITPVLKGNSLRFDTAMAFYEAGKKAAEGGVAGGEGIDRRIGGILPMSCVRESKSRHRRRQIRRWTV